MFVLQHFIYRGSSHSKLIAVLLATWAAVAPASDHSDAPQAEGVVRQDANLTDLHAFVRGKNLVISVCSNPAIPRTAATYQFPSDLTFEIHLDNQCQVDPADPDGMGGTVMNPSKVHPDYTFRVRFREDGSPRVQTFAHRGNKKVTVENFFAGLRDDPFIRGPRQGRNVGAIVLELPLKSVTRHQSSLLIWATSQVEDFDGPFQDLIGRSLRSMMPENSEMNDMQPRQHGRKMGVAPDVMIFDTARPAQYPNGRALTDDVVDLVGDPRVLGNDAPFPSGNDLPFLDVFPYLATPHPVPATVETIQ